MKKLQDIFPHFLRSLLNSYSQVFFSNNPVFAILLIIVTFFDLYAGICGLLAVITSNSLAYIIGFNRYNIKSGYYGFNSLLVGLGIGLNFEPGLQFLLILLFAVLLTLMITVTLEGIIGKYGLPYLSIPFLLGIWMVSLASRQFHALTLSERDIYTYNELYALGGSSLVKIYSWFNDLQLPSSITIYFRSLGAIFFQYHVVPGIIVAIGLLMYSRIGFLLSLTGYFSAFFYYQLIGANFNELNYGYIGFNFILTAIAIGGFFVISSRWSFLCVILLTPLISFTITSTIAVLGVYQLLIFSLPFNIIVLMFLYIMRFRERYYLRPEMVVIQRFSPEKNLYFQLNNKARFKNYQYLPLSLPFYGGWTVTQAHDGKHTHKSAWRHAWDFEITDENGLTYLNQGDRKEDYYCFNLPVLAPADGWIVEAIDYIEDNEIGEVNIEQNWGNTLIIKHTEGLYTKICHLKKESLKVNKGDYVKRGDIIASCGNSGRSPKPHIHFQVQATAFTGSRTVDYPLGTYVVHKDGIFLLKSYDKPLENEIISNIEKNNTLQKAFNLIPGQSMHFEILSPSDKEGQLFHWEIQADVYNNTFIFCEQTNSRAYFKNDGNFHYFTHFEGNKRSLLFCFYLATYRVLCGFYRDLEVNDSFPPNDLNNKALTFLQDFVAPFFLFTKSHYTLNYLNIEDHLGNSALEFHSSVRVNVGRIVTKTLDFDFRVENNRFDRFIIHDKNKRIEVHEIRTV